MGGRQTENPFRVPFLQQVVRLGQKVWLPRTRITRATLWISSGGRGVDSVRTLPRLLGKSKGIAQLEVILWEHEIELYQAENKRLRSTGKQNAKLEALKCSDLVRSAKSRQLSRCAQLRDTRHRDRRLQRHILYRRHYLLLQKRRHLH